LRVFVHRFEGSRGVLLEEEMEIAEVRAESEPVILLRVEELHERIRLLAIERLDNGLLLFHARSDAGRTAAIHASGGFTYSKSTGIPLMPFEGGAIQFAILPRS